MRKWVFLATLLPCWLAADVLPRKVIALYDSKVEPEIAFTHVHQLAEMPMNYLGFVFEYHDIEKPLPDLEGRNDVIGVISWFEDDTSLPFEKNLQLFEWSKRCLELGKKYLILGKTLFTQDEIDLPLETINTFWEKLGLRLTGDWVGKTYNMTLVQPYPYLTEFETSYRRPYQAYLEIIKVSDSVVSWLIGVDKERKLSQSILTAISPSGGYVADGFAHFSFFKEGIETRKWYLNPFWFFRNVFDSENMPKPDTTTIAGRRTFYSQVDGDGWNNVTEIEKYPSGTISAIVLYQEICKPYTDIPISIGPIAADLDPEWAAVKDSRLAAEEIFKLPHIQVGCHSWSHPFNWAFFKNYRPQDEIPFLSRYPQGSWMGTGFIVKMKEFFNSSNTMQNEESKRKQKILYYNKYEVPRAFANKPFSLKRNITGAIDYIDKLAPKGKKVSIYLWTGDCLPFYKAVKGVLATGIMDINGGNSRFDNEYNSYAWVMPLGRPVRNLWQVYASNANEDLYTNLWRSNFWGFNLLPETFKNTETPVRISPMDLYFHIYSGQKLSSLKALKQNLAYIRTQSICPVKTCHYSSVVYGFYAMDIDQKDNNTWQFINRGSLQTIRFDNAVLKTVDFSKSLGVIGLNVFQGSLYVYLDSAFSSDPVIALKDHKDYYTYPKEPRYYLIDSRWQISNVQGDQSKMTFQAEGFGPGEMTWNVPEEGDYEVQGGKQKAFEAASKDHRINFIINESAIEPIHITILKKS